MRERDISLSMYFLHLISIEDALWTSRWSGTCFANKIIWDEYQEIPENSSQYEDSCEDFRHNRDIFTELHKAFQLQKDHSKKYPSSNRDACKVDERPDLY
jgi:hypothetical protein